MQAIYNLIFEHLLLQNEHRIIFCYFRIDVLESQPNFFHERQSNLFDADGTFAIK